MRAKDKVLKIFSWIMSIAVLSVTLVYAFIQGSYAKSRIETERQQIKDLAGISGFGEEFVADSEAIISECSPYVTLSIIVAGIAIAGFILSLIFHKKLMVRAGATFVYGALATLVTSYRVPYSEVGSNRSMHSHAIIIAVACGVLLIISVLSLKVGEILPREKESK